MKTASFQRWTSGDFCDDHYVRPPAPVVKITSFQRSTSGSNYTDKSALLPTLEPAATDYYSDDHAATCGWALLHTYMYTYMYRCATLIPDLPGGRF